MQLDRINERFKKINPQLAFNSTAAQDPAEWRLRVRDTVRRLVPPSPALRVREVTGDENRGLRCERITFEAADGAMLKAILLRPREHGVFPFILTCPGRNTRMEYVTGLLPGRFPGENIAELLAQRGFATLTADYGLIGNINAAFLKGRDEINLLSLAASLLHLSPLALVLNDLLGCLSWVEQQAWFDGKDLSLFGRSLGGFVATYLALLCDNIRCVALSSCLCSYPSISGQYFEANGASALPGILHYADFPDLVSAIVPTPLHLQYADNDPVFPCVEAEQAAAQVRRAFECFSASSGLEIFCTDRGHGTDADRVVDFFCKCLQTHPQASSL